MLIFKDIKRILMHGCLIIVIIILIDLFSFTELGDDILGRITFSTGYKNIGSGEIIPAINTAETNSNHTKIVLGDSVCHQIFNSFADSNSEYLLLGTNQAITIGGQYILTKLFVESHTNVTDVYLVFLPESFSVGSDSKLSYSYLVEPFGAKDKLDYLLDISLSKMKKIYGDILMNKRIISIIDNSCINNKIFLFNNQKKIESLDKEVSGGIISEETKSYLIELKKYCDDNGIQLHLLPSPMRDSKIKHELVGQLKKEVSEKGLEDVFEDYFSCIYYYPEYMFPDGTHFGGKYADEETYIKCINNIAQKSRLFNGLSY